MRDRQPGNILGTALKSDRKLRRRRRCRDRGCSERDGVECSRNERIRAGGCCSRSDCRASTMYGSTRAIHSDGPCGADSPARAQERGPMHAKHWSIALYLKEGGRMSGKGNGRTRAGVETLYLRFGVVVSLPTTCIGGSQGPRCSVGRNGRWHRAAYDPQMHFHDRTGDASLARGGAPGKRE